MHRNETNDARGAGAMLTRRTMLARTAFAGSLAALLAACGNDGPPQAAPPGTAAAVDVPPDETAPHTAHGQSPPADAVDATGTAQVMVLARDNSFAPQELIVSAGTEVTWRNGGRTEHDVVPVDPDQQWGVALADFPPGATTAHVFDEPGTFAYYCTIHGTAERGMIGTIHVVRR